MQTINEILKIVFSFIGERYKEPDKNFFKRILTDSMIAADN